MKKEKIDWKIALIGVIAIVIIVCFALAKGVDGLLVSAALTILGLFLGVAIPNPFKKK